MYSPKFYLTTIVKKRSADYTKSPFRYPGGKFYALKQILPVLNCVPHDEFREPFVGGGSIFFSKPKSLINWINDLDTDLVSTYRVLADELMRKELCILLKNEIADRGRHSEIKGMAANSMIEVAFKTYYLNRTSYSGIINSPAWGYETGKSSPPKNWINFIEMAGKKLINVKITNLDFEDVITAEAKGNQVLIYLDPPYYHADQKRAYTKPFELDDHLRLTKLLRDTHHLFCLSYDDCEEIRNLYSWANIYECNWLYNTANVKGNNRKKGNELLITNYEILRDFQNNLF